ncbi:heat stress transcription factor A-8 [Malania oleifera]|uniref:heat stress transcription factor A-8 n=1 Tax=Malania oleifera TaxID=397392 RepID=UPI0025AE22B1|nr:heat stress transcription factor A-8 [Malania oleifera]
MVKESAGDAGAKIAPFLTKCYDLVDDQSTDEVISWNQTSSSFVIWDMTQFTVQLLPKYFKHSNFSSFVRQLNIYGFRKIDSDRWEFANDEFVKGQKHLLKNIVRRKHSQGLVPRKSSQQNNNAAEACEEIENFGLLKEVENLKIDRNALMQELVKLRQHHETTENKVLLLRDRLQGMEKNQQQMLSFLVMVMQCPGFLVQLLQPKENNWRTPEAVKNMLQEVTGDGESDASDGMMVRYWPQNDGTSKPLLTQASNSEESLESDPSFEKIKDFFMNIDFRPTLPIDEKFLSSAAIPDLPNDEMLEQLLLAAPFLENIEQEDNGSGVVLESEIFETQLDDFLSLECSPEQVDKSQYSEMDSVAHEVHVEISLDSVHLTDQTGLPSSETQQQT